MTFDKAAGIFDARVTYNHDERSATLVVDAEGGYFAITFKDDGIFYYNSVGGNVTNWNK